MENSALALADRMEAALVARARGGPNADPPVEERTKIRASVLASACPRKCHYWLTGAEEDKIEAATASAFTDGKEYEAGILNDILAALGVGEELARTQVPADTYWYTGTADLVIYDSLYAGKLIASRVSPNTLYEFKTANPTSFSMRVKEGRPGDSYENQAQLYMNALEIGRCVFVFRNKAPKKGERIYWTCEVTREGAAIERLRAIAQKAHDSGSVVGVLPDRADYAARTAWQCRYCSFYGTCWNGRAIKER